MSTSDEPKRPGRADFQQALQSMDTYIDITVDDLMALTQRAEQFAGRRATEAMGVRRVMSQPVLTVHPQTLLTDAAHLMVSKRISGLPVIDDAERLVGIITETDIFSTLVEVLGGGEPGLRVDLRVADQKGVLAQVAQTIAGAGGNIVSLTTFHGEDTAHSILSIKVRGADENGLRAGLDALTEVEIVDFRPSGTGCAVNFG